MSVQPNHQKNRRVASIAAGVVLGMVGLSYASVPLYRAFCQATGFGGTTQIAKQAPTTTTAHEMSVRFDANVADNLGWAFHPSVNTMKVKVGEPTLTHFVARNDTSAPETGSAVFNVTPVEAGVYFNKIQCFCFTEQTLQPGQTIELPVQYFIDPAILDDADTKSISEITLSYTFYPAKSKLPATQANALQN